MARPVIAITMGDPAGIGPELIVKVLAERDAHSRCRPFIVGDVSAMRQIGRVVGTELEFRSIEDLSQASFSFPAVDVLRPPRLRLGRVVWGRLDANMGRAAALCLERALELALVGKVQGIVSAPLNKEAFHLAGYDYSDELAFAADLTDSPHTYMMGVMQDALWTVTVTEHIPFREIAASIKRERILRHVIQMDEVLRLAGGATRRVAVAALNVHAGEGGLYGREEIDEIGPAIGDARALGIDATGPIPADTVFARALSGEFDAVVAMYHDQANIVRKLQPVGDRVTLFVGLPVICATTTHGTAFDIAGQGIADPGSLAGALRYAARLAAER